MRTLSVTVLCLVALTAASPAQVRLGARLGATWSSTLATDEIGTNIKVKTGIAPTLSLTASIPSGRKFRLGLETVLTTSSVEASDDQGTNDLGSLRTASLLLTAEGPAMFAGIYWRVGLGLIKFLPSEKQGLFLQGGPTRITGNLTAEYRKAIKPGWEFAAGVRYGIHQFTTKELQSRGFSRSQMVHRVGLELGAARYF